MFSKNISVTVFGFNVICCLHFQGKVKQDLGRETLRDEERKEGTKRALEKLRGMVMMMMSPEPMNPYTQNNFIPLSLSSTIHPSLTLSLFISRLDSSSYMYSRA